MFAAMNRQRDSLVALNAGLAEHLGGEQGRKLLALMLSGGGVDESVNVFICSAIHTIFAHEFLSPEQLYAVTLRFVQVTHRSTFSSHLVPRLVPWARAAWQRAIENRFAIRNPRSIVPAIQDALAVDANELSTVAAILLAAEGGVSVRLHASLRDMLRGLAGEAGRNTD
jgi:hypothetical protein